jgi:glycerate-2-kinase
MAEGAVAVLDARIRDGKVSTPDGYGRPVANLTVNEAAHPVPDARSVTAASEALAFAEGLGPDDVLLVLISGGASSLWTAPVEGVPLEDKQTATEQLLRAGVDISQLNTVRKHLSRIKGGGLALRAHPARVVTLVISDVRGDRLDTIGSGPTAPDPTIFGEALAVLPAEAPESIRTHLQEGAAGRRRETPKPGEAAFERVEYRCVATLDDALAASVRAAERRGLRVWSLGPCLYGEAREEARFLAQRVDTARDRGVDLVVAGGEPTVTVRGSGRGGRAQELALAFSMEVAGEPVAALFAGTDGADGPTDAAGASVDGQTVARARSLGLDPADHLTRNDAYPLFDRLGALLRTGPTDTNVTDLALIRLFR